jgi:hypothetical protein
VGGFIPRTFAKHLLQEGEPKTIEKCKDLAYLPANLESLVGSDDHYNMFEAMISGRDWYVEEPVPNQQFRPIFKAQLLKDEAMAFCVSKILNQA